jgi:branched-chain amino acid transport system ATP-binding protein
MSAVSSNHSGYALQTQGLVKRFGGITATDHVNLNIVPPCCVVTPTKLSISVAITERAEALLEQFHLTDVMQQRTEHLAYGKRRLLEMAIALACEPRVLLLDEPVAGVPAGERDELLQTVAALPSDVSIVLIEHDMDLVFNFADRITVLVNGAVLTEGTPQEIAHDPQVKAVYLGTSHD